MCQWDFYRVSTGRRQSLNCLYHRGDTVSSLPVDARAATVSLQGPHTRFLSVYPSDSSQLLSPMPSSGQPSLRHSMLFRLLPLGLVKKSLFHRIFAPSLCPSKMALPMLSATDLSMTSLGHRHSPSSMLKSAQSSA